MGKSIDEIFEDIGQMGRFQISRLALFCAMIFSPAFQALIMYFVAYESPWQCVGNSTTCLLNGTFAAGDENYNFRCKLNRSDWEYASSHDEPRTSIISEFDLVCDDAVYGWLATSMVYIGMSIASYPVGILSDRYGRLLPLFPSFIITVVVGFASSFAKHYWQFLLSRLVIGICDRGCLLPMIILSGEFVGPRYRPLSQIIMWVSYSIALIIEAWIAYYVREWRTLMIICTVPWIVVVFFWKFIPESVRWNATHDKVYKAENTLREIAKTNNKEYPNERLSIPSQDTGSLGCLALFSSCSLALCIFIQAFTCFVNSMVYFGVSYGAGDFEGNIYLNFILASLVEIPASIVAIYSCRRFGRKRTVITALILGGTSCVIVSLIPSGTKRTDYIAGRVIAGMLGKGFITMSFNSNLVWATELFPTVLRGSALSFLDVLTCVGAVAAPFVVEAKRVHSVLPFAIMGVMAVTAALICLVLPDTKDKPTAEVLEIAPEKGDTIGAFQNKGTADVIKESSDAFEMEGNKT